MKRLAIILITTALAAIALGATLTARSGRAASETPAATVLTYYVYGQADLLECWRKFCRNYVQNNPGIKIRLIHVPGFNEYFSKVLVSIAAGEAPDVVFMNSVQIPAFVDRGALLPLNAAADGDDYFPEALELFTYRDKLWALPSDLAIYVLYYNPVLFERYGVPFPDKDWTWDDLINAARQLTIMGEDGRVRQFGMVRGNPYLWIWQNGGTIVDDVGNPRYSTFNSPATIEAIRLMRDLEWKYRVIPASTSQKEMDTEQMFKTGRVAMVLGGHWWIPSFAKANQNFRVAVIPGNKRRVSYFSGSGFSILSTTKHPEEAKRFVRYLAGPEAQKVLADLNFGFPARKSIARSPAFLNSVPGLDKQAFLDSVPYLQRVPQTPHYNQIDTLIWRGLEYVWTLKQSPEENAEELARAITKVLSREVQESVR